MMPTRFPVSAYGRRPRRVAAWWGVGVIILTLIIVVFFGGVIFDPLAELAGFIVPGAAQGQAALGRAVETMTRSRADLVAENERLQSWVAELQAALSTAQSLSRENESLRRELSLIHNEPGAIAGEVLPSLGPLPYNLLRVAVGDGVRVRPGAEVRAGALTLGRVLAQAGPVLKVELLSAPGRVTGVRLGAAGTAVEAIGQGAGTWAVSLPRGVPVAVGEWALSASSTNPLAVGVVGAVVSDPAQSLQTVYLELPFGLGDLRHVEILDH
jgi:hypothetical protein